jgi:hypothetical protein
MFHCAFILCNMAMAGLTEIHCVTKLVGRYCSNDFGVSVT